MDSKYKTLHLECDCTIHGLRLSYWDDDPDEVYLSFWIEEFYARQTGFWDSLWNRIKIAFKVMCKGDYFLHEIILNKKDMKRLKEYVGRF